MRTLSRQNSTARNHNFVHTPKPPIKILLVLVGMLLSGGSAKGQLLSYDQYALSLKKYYNAMWSAERSEFVNIQKGKNWNLIPSVGLVFGLPSVNLNTGQIAAYKARQAEVKAKLKSIDLKYELLLNEELNNLRLEVEKARNEEYKLQTYTNELDTRDKIFKIHTEAFAKKEMKPLDFYKERLAHDLAEQEYQLAVRNYGIVVLNVQKLARYNLPQERIYYDGSLDHSTASDGDLLDIHPDKLPASIFGTPTIVKPVKNGLGN